MQKSCAGEPRHQRSVLNRIPEPETSPTEFVIGPVRTHRNADGKKHPGGESPWSHPPCPGGVYPSFDQGSYCKRERNRKANITEVEQGGMNGETDVLQDRIKVTAFEWRLCKTQERIRSEKNE